MIPKVLFICAALAFTSNLFVYNAINSVEDRNLVRTQIAMEGGIRDNVLYDLATESEKEELERIYRKVSNEILIEENQKILQLENESFTLGWTFMNGIGVFMLGIGKEFDLMKLVVKGDDMIQNYPMADRGIIIDDSSPFHKPILAKTGYLCGKFFHITLSFLLLIIGLILKKYWSTI